MNLNLFRRKEENTNPNKDNLLIFLENEGFEIKNVYSLKKWLKAFSYVSIGIVEINKGKDEYGVWKEISEKYLKLNGEKIFAINIPPENKKEKELLIPITSEEYEILENNSLNSEIIENIQYDARIRFANNNEAIFECIQKADC